MPLIAGVKESSRSHSSKEESFAQEKVQLWFGNIGMRTAQTFVTLIGMQGVTEAIKSDDGLSGV